MAGPVIVPGGDAPTGVLFPLYRRRLSKLLGVGNVYTTTAAADGDERLRHVIISRLADDELSIEDMAGLHLYVADGDNAGHQTRVASTGTHGPLGLLEIAKELTTALVFGTTIELSGSLPAKSYNDWPCLDDCVNEALDALTVEVPHALTFVAQQVRYDLSALIWRSWRRESVIDVYPPIPTGYTAVQTRTRPINRGRWSVEYSGESPYLELRGWGCNPGETFFVTMKRPASTWIQSGGTWGSASGLTSDSQAALYDVDTVANMAAPIACERLVEYWLDRRERLLERDDEAGAKKCEIRAARWTAKGDKLADAALVARIGQAFRGDGRQRLNGIGARHIGGIWGR